MDKRKLKVAIVGSGSTYTPELIKGFISRKDSLKVDSFYMMDINREKNTIVSNLAKRMLKNYGMDTQVVITENLSEAIENADYVLGQIRVGGLDSRIKDEKIPLKYNLLGQETTGAGGFMKALRTLPVLEEIAHVIEQKAPNAWFINFSNPSGIIAEMLLNHTNVKSLGLCNNPINMVKTVKEILNNSVKELDYEYVGLNHLSWITKVIADGVNMDMKKLLNNAISADMKNVPSMSYDEPLVNATRGLPCAYLNYYYFRDETIKKCQESELVRGEECKAIEAELLELYKDASVKDKPEVLEKRGGALYSEAAVSLVDCIENDKNEVHVVNVKNNGALEFMSDDDVVEVKCIINKNGATPIKIKNFDNLHIIGLMQAVKAYEKLAVKASRQGDYSSALEALLVHPLVGDYFRAKSVLDEMLEANSEYLPQFNSVQSKNGSKT